MKTRRLQGAGVSPKLYLDTCSTFLGSMLLGKRFAVFELRASAVSLSPRKWGPLNYCWTIAHQTRTTPLTGAGPITFEPEAKHQGRQARNGV